MMHLEAIVERNKRPAPQPSRVSTALARTFDHARVAKILAESVGPMDREIFVRDEEGASLADILRAARAA